METLKDMCELIIDCEHKTAPKLKDGYPSIRTPNIGKGRLILDSVNKVSEDTYRAWTKRATPRAGDLILAREAPAGNVAIIPENLKVCLGQRTVLIRPNILRVDPHYLLYLLLEDNIQAKILSLGAGATVPHVNMSDIRNLKLPTLPSLSVQKKIGKILSAYDDLIENNLRRIKILEEMAKTIYEEWFVKFRFLGYEKVKMVESELGPIPEGWEIEKLNKYVTFEKGVEPGSKNYKETYEEGRLPFLRVGDLGNRGPTIYIDSTLAKGKVVTENDIVVSFDGTPGVVRIGLSGCYSTGIRKLLIKKDVIKQSFLYLLMQSENIQNTIKSHSKGTTIIHASTSIEHMVFSLPPEELMNKFDELVGLMIQNVLAQKNRNTNLQKTRDLLLPKLISGEIDVEHLDIKTGDLNEPDI